MENLITLAQLKKNEPLLLKHIFTSLQLRVLKKKIKHELLNNNEKTYYYKFIKPKIKALLAFSGREEMVINGEEEMITERIHKAKEVIGQMQKKHKTARIMVSDSFLFNRKFRDIDVFVFTKYQKEDYRWKRVHMNFLPESALDSLFFSSLSQVSISNFKPELKKQFNLSIKKLLQTYELLVQEILAKENYQKELRNFLLEVEFLTKNIILNPKQLYLLREKFARKNILLLLQKYLAESLVLNYQKADLKLLQVYIQDYQKLSKRYKESANLQNYVQTYQEALELAS